MNARDALGVVTNSVIDSSLYQSEEKAEALATLTALVERAGEPVWRPIETAPKSTADVLLYCEDTGEQFVGFPVGDGRWLYAQKDGAQFTWKPSHWQPLPLPPAAPGASHER